MFILFLIIFLISVSDKTLTPTHLCKIAMISLELCHYFLIILLDVGHYGWKEIAEMIVWNVEDMPSTDHALFVMESVKKYGPGILTW